MKTPSKPIKQAHTARTKTGSGDFYGQAIKQKMGRPISIMTQTPAKKKSMKTPPKALA